MKVEFEIGEYQQYSDEFNFKKKEFNSLQDALNIVDLLRSKYDFYKDRKKLAIRLYNDGEIYRFGKDPNFEFTTFKEDLFKKYPKLALSKETYSFNQIHEMFSDPKYYVKFTIVDDIWEGTSQEKIEIREKTGEKDEYRGDIYKKESVKVYKGTSDGKFREALIYEETEKYIKNLNTNFEFKEDENTKYAKTSTGQTIPFKLYDTNDDRPKFNLLRESGDKVENNDFALVERRWVENNYLQFLGNEKINDHYDVAWLFKSLEDEAVEHAFLVYHFEDKGYFVQHISSGTLDATLVDNRMLIGNILKLKPEAITFVHNHPSGQLKASMADRICLNALKKSLEHTDIKVNDGIIINLRTGQYLVYNSQDYLFNYGIEPKSRMDVKAYSFSKHVFVENYNPTKISSAKEVAEYLNTQKFGISDKMEMLILNKQLAIVGKFVLPRGNISDFIIEKLSDYGGVTCILYGNQMDPAVINRINENMKNSKYNISDAILFRSENGEKIIHSFLNQGLLDSVEEPKQDLTKEYKTDYINNNKNLRNMDEVKIPWLEKQVIKNSKEIVGQLTFKDSNEVVSYTSEESYLNAIKSEFHSVGYNHFTYTTLIETPSLLKGIDDLVYGYWDDVENPNDIKYYEQLINSKKEIMENNQQKDFDQVAYLKNQIKYLGFGEDEQIHNELQAGIKAPEKQFQIKTTSDKTLPGNKVEFTLNFNKSDKGGVFLNSYDAVLQKENETISHNFNISRDQSFTAKEAINLLEGRAVKTEFLNPKSNEREPVFVKLNFNEEKTEKGNYLYQNFYKNYGINTPEIVEKSNLVFDKPEYKDNIIKSLEKGNVVKVKFEHEGTQQEGLAVLNPQYKNISLYDMDMNRLNTNKPIQGLGKEEVNEKNNVREHSISRGI